MLENQVKLRKRNERKDHMKGVRHEGQMESNQIFRSNPSSSIHWFSDLALLSLFPLSSSSSLSCHVRSHVMQLQFTVDNFRYTLLLLLLLHVYHMLREMREEEKHISMFVTHVGEDGMKCRFRLRSHVVSSLFLTLSSFIFIIFFGIEKFESFIFVFFYLFTFPSQGLSLFIRTENMLKEETGWSTSSEDVMFFTIIIIMRRWVKQTKERQTVRQDKDDKMHQRREKTNESKVNFSLSVCWGNRDNRETTEKHQMKKLRVNDSSQQ